jgi:hypothetical protein
MLKGVSISKFEVPHTNEDAIITKDNLFAIADGAGGYGIFADEWSRYLLSNLPGEAIKDYVAFQSWISDIWELFYNKKESEIYQYDGFVQNKFYKEGSCSTLVACWIEEEYVYWIKYGDSALFIYDKENNSLGSWPKKVMDFQKNPYLINWKEEVKETAFEYGKVQMKDQLIFLASDTLACYLLLSYKILHNVKDEDMDELRKNNLAIGNQYNACLDIINKGACFYDDIVKPLILNADSEKDFTNYIKTLVALEVIQPDDYSFIYYQSDI